MAAKKMSYPDLLSYSPSCPPDWRWRRANDLVRRGLYVTRGRDGGWTGRAVRYLRAWQRCRTDRRRAKVVQAYYDVHVAKSLHEGDGPLRLLVQARLLARQSSVAITLCTGLPPPVIDAYEALFFSCRDRLDACDWILTHAVGRRLVPGTATPDPAGVLKAFAYYGGPRVLDAVLPYLLGGQDCLAPPGDLSTPAARRDQAARLAVAAQLLPRDPATDKKLFKIALLVREWELRRPKRRPATPLLTQNLDARLAEAPAGPSLGRAGDNQTPSVAAAAEALAQLA